MSLSKTAFLVTRPGLGATAPEDAAFALEMIDKFFHTLERQAERPYAICFYTEGVRLVTEGSSVALGLGLLEKLGVRILACQTCLQYYGLMDRVVVGTVGGVPDILQVMAEADKVITI
jgi:sulfur relay (sulfurtransferase) complex TusBCD TusD component (DsrE family)